MGKDAGQKSDKKQKSNTKLKYFFVLEVGVVICCFGLLVAMIVMFCGLKNTLINKFLESNIKQDDSYFVTDAKNLDVDIKDDNRLSFNYKKEMVETKGSKNVKETLIYVYSVSVFLILLLFLFLFINHIHDNITLHKKLYFLNEKYEDAVKRYAEKRESVYENKKQIKGEDKDKNSESVISEKKYPDMKELFKAYSNALLEL